ncbi:MAG: HNH endonuclease [Chloroflexi bacterium]|nr:HNH endonuclease [Chloroflexota bacterium]
MSQTYISKALRRKVTIQARHRCGYCLTREAVVGMPMEIEHLIPEALGGLTEEDNLWLACPLCNAFKGYRINALDVVTGEVVPLFNPRQQVWSQHFAWNPAGIEIIALTAIGRATLEALQLNRELLVEARSLWVAAGLHPPKD